MTNGDNLLGDPKNSSRETVLQLIQRTKEVMSLEKDLSASDLANIIETLVEEKDFETFNKILKGIIGP